MNELSALPRKAPTLTGAYNTGYTACFCSPKCSVSPRTSYVRKTLYEIPNPALKNKKRKIFKCQRKFSEYNNKRMVRWN